MEIDRTLTLAPRHWAEPVASQRLVVIAASAGGLNALGRVLSSLPADFPAAIAVVQHRGEQNPELLPELLLQLTAAGKPSEQIALLLGVDLETVESHRRQIMERLRIDDPVGLTTYAIRRGLASSAV